MAQRDEFNHSAKNLIGHSSTIREFETSFSSRFDLRNIHSQSPGHLTDRCKIQKFCARTFFPVETSVLSLIQHSAETSLSPRQFRSLRPQNIPVKDFDRATLSGHS